jgi:putative colanic acid biosynthesis acetyltransferase WcaF
MGATIGKGVRMYSSTSVYFPWNLRLGNYVSLGEHALIYNLGPVFIDDHVTVSQRAHVCAGSHDYTRPEMPLEKPPVSIGRHAWICADAFIGPNVHIEEGAVVAARAVVVKNVSAWDVVGGNPAKFIKKRVLVS